MMNSKESFGAEEEDLGVLHTKRLRSRKHGLNYTETSRRKINDLLNAL